MRRLIVVATLVVGWLAMTTQVSFADDDDDHRRHQHHRGVAKHRIGIQLYSPLGIRVTEHQDQYRYVVPSRGRHGAYYTHGNARYYMPPVVRVVGQQPQATPRPVPIEFGGFRHHEELAERLETLANQICLELHHNYQQNRGFDDVYREAYALLQAAKYIHGKEHAGDKAAIQRSVRSIDELFHHVQEHVDGWRSANRRQVGELNLFGKTEEFEAVLHHLMYEIGVKPAHDDPNEEAPSPRDQAPPREDAPPPRQR